MVQVLSDHPDQWQLLREQPDLAPRAVDELMRHSPIIFGTIRVASEDVELCGLTIPAGTLVNVNTSAANRDPAVFADPARLDVTREIGPTAMLTFGGGVHYCLGVHLAKMELAEALRVLTQRMASVRVTAPVEWKPVVGISGPVALAIEFDAA
jgi:cytochrome P450